MGSAESKVQSILFVCMGNSCRSPMAEVLARQTARKRGLQVLVSSAGTDAGGFVQPQAATAVAVVEDISGRECRQVTSAILRDADLVLVMDETQLNDPILAPAGTKVHLLREFGGGRGSIPDPFGGTQDEYDDCRQLLEVAVDAALDRIAR